MIICEEALKHPHQALHTSSNAVTLKSQIAKPNDMGFTRIMILASKFRRQRLERKKQAEEELIRKINDDIMPLTDRSDTSPPKYEPGEYNVSDNNDVNNDDDIVPTPGSKTQEPMLALPLSSWHACRCNLAKDLTKPATEEENSSWDQDLMPVRKISETFEDPHGNYRILGCRRLSSDK